MGYMENSLTRASYDSRGRPVRARRRPSVISRPRETDMTLLLHHVTGMSYEDLTTAVERLPRERRDRLNAIAGEILDDARDIGTPD